MMKGLAEYAERRRAFRDWLLAQLNEGVHFGIPPGCEPKTQVQANGEVWYGVWQRGGSYTFYPPSQWKPKPSLYKAGADFILDLMGARDEYESDLAAWEQLGKPAGTFVRKCRLYSKQTGEFMGEGTGARRLGAKGGDENNAIKMADKAAKVAAVLNTWGLADLFTQDLEDKSTPPPAHDNPDADPNAPKADARGERVTPAQLKALVGEWRKTKADLTKPEKEQREDWFAFVRAATDKVFAAGYAKDWIQEDVLKVKWALGIEPPPDVQREPGEEG
jgi:hypothetical protein